MRLPLGPASVSLDETSVGALEIVDHSTMDWERVRSIAYLVHQRITYVYEGPVTRLRQRLVVQPPERHGDQRRIAHRLEVLDAQPRRVSKRLDAFGNHVIHVSIPWVPERVTFVSWSIVERHTDHATHHVEPERLLDPRLHAPTRLTAADAALRAMADDLGSRGLDGADLAHAACSAVHSALTYAHDVTTVRTTAAEALALGAGVCQDYAHVLVAVCRALGFATRYVSGHLLGEGGSHAWVEVLVPCGDNAEIVALDPTHDRPAGMSYLTIAVGRDYADVAPMSGTYQAPHGGFLTARKRVALMEVVLAAPA
jgi:transglutaminase-like putative cysteine protease